MADITLLDGGMGQELVARSGDAPTPLWATRVMLDHPGLVQAIHADYFAAGATIATTNTYAIHHDRLAGFGLDDQFAALHQAAVDQAIAARAAHGTGRIAGFVGPLIASYRSDVVQPVKVAAPKYAEIAAILAPQVDFFILETMASITQAEGALIGASGHGVPVWLSVTVDDADGTRLRSGEPVSDLAALVAVHRPAAILANCSVPEAMPAAMAELGRLGLPFGAYANGFTHIDPKFLADRPTVDELTHRHDLTPARHCEMAMGWVTQGATIVGGCCEVGPDHIRALAKALRAAGHHIV
jgi:homocysteine S-methyltransferase